MKLRLHPLTVLGLGLLIACGDKDHDHHDSGDTDASDTDTDTDADTDTDTDTDADADLAINGSYLDGFGTSHTVTNTLWTQTYGQYTPSNFNVTSYDNDAGYVIAENDAGNDFNAGEFSRFDWFVDGDENIWYCQTTYTAATADDALATPRANDSDVTVSGCGDYNFSWTNLTP